MDASLQECFPRLRRKHASERDTPMNMALTNGEKQKQILEAAESLFSERGYEQTTTRMLATQAQTGLASIHYYFGSKSSLLNAVLIRCVFRVNDERLKRLATVEELANGIPPSPLQITECFFGPILDNARTIGRKHASFQSLLGKSFLTTYDTRIEKHFQSALSRALPDMNDSELAWRLYSMCGMASCIISGHQIIESPGASGENIRTAGSPATLLSDLTSFLLGRQRNLASSLEA